MYIDKTKDGLQNVIDLINLANGISLPKNGGVGFSVPTAYAGPSGHNTKITLTGDPDYSYEGTQDVYYTRIGLDDNVAMPPVRHPISRSLTSAQFLDQVADALNLVKSELQPLGVIAQNAPNVTLNPIANSLLYVGSLNLALKWPTGSAFTFLLDTFTGTEALSAHVSDDGTRWWGNYGEPTGVVAGQLSSGQLAQTDTSIWAYANKTVPSLHTAIFKFTIVSTPISTDLEISSGGSRYNYHLYLEVSNDGKLYWNFYRKDLTNQNLSGNFSWALGPQEAKVVVLHDTTELWINGILRATFNTQRYLDTNIPYFHMDNGSALGSIKIDSFTVESNDPMEEAPLNLWLGSTRGTNRRGENSQLVVGDKLWSCNGRYLQSFNCETGELVSEFDFNTLLSISGANYELSCTDVKNGYLWLEDTAGANPNWPTIVRIDPNANGGLGAIKDTLFAATNATTSYSSLTQGHSADGVWAARTQGSTKEIVNLHPDTGAVISATSIAGISGFVSGMTFDGYGSRLMFTTSGAELRFFSTNTKALVGPVYTNRSSIAAGDAVGGTAGVYAINFNDATGNYSLVRYSSTDMSQTEVDIVSAELPPNDDSVWVHGPMRLFNDLNEVMFIVERFDPEDNASYNEIWSFDQDTLAFRRKVIPGAANRAIYDFCLDYGNLYAELLLDGAPRTSKLVRSYLT